MKFNNRDNLSRYNGTFSATSEQRYAPRPYYQPQNHRPIVPRYPPHYLPPQINPSLNYAPYSPQTVYKPTKSEESKFDNEKQYSSHENKIKEELKTFTKKSSKSSSEICACTSNDNQEVIDAVLESIRSSESTQRIESSNSQMEVNMVTNFCRFYYKIGPNAEEAREKLLFRLTELLNNNLARLKGQSSAVYVPTEDTTQAIMNHKFEEWEQNAFLKKCTTSKMDSSEIQFYISIISEDQVQKIYDLIKPFVMDMCFDKYSNYVIQSIVGKVRAIREEISSLFIDSLEKMLPNEYASRVLQKMIMYRDCELTKYVLKKFRDDYKYFMKTLSGMLFVIKLVSHS